MLLLRIGQGPCSTRLSARMRVYDRTRRLKMATMDVAAVHQVSASEAGQVTDPGHGEGDHRDGQQGSVAVLCDQTAENLAPGFGVLIVLSGRSD